MSIGGVSLLGQHSCSINDLNLNLQDDIPSSLWPSNPSVMQTSAFGEVLTCTVPHVPSAMYLCLTCFQTYMYLKNVQVIASRVHINLT